MKTRIVWTKIHFEDDWFSTLNLSEKYLYIYLFTNSHIGLTGIYKLSKRVAMLETGATSEVWDSSCEKFRTANKAKFYDEWIYLVNSYKYSNYSGPKNEQALKKEFDLIPSTVIDTLSIPYPYPSDTTINKKLEIINKKQETINNKYILIGNTMKER